MSHFLNFWDFANYDLTDTQSDVFLSKTSFTSIYPKTRTTQSLGFLQNSTM